MTKSLLIMTVGTGTAGAHSNLAQGLVTTLKKLAPRAYWLVPSASGDSQVMAELIRQEVPEGCMGLSPIERHDDIFCCRETVRRVIREAKASLKEGESLLVNPTSGTKQMSAGATLAALDEEVGDLVFTVGERQDGVVKTGTESLVDFSTQAFFYDRDVRIAKHLFESGSYWAAGEVLASYSSPEARRLSDTALCAHEWLRQNYAKAAVHAARLDAGLNRQLLDLARVVESQQPDEKVLRDILSLAAQYGRWKDAEQSLAHAYKALEYAARLRLCRATGLRLPFEHKRLVALKIPEKTKGELRINHDGSCTPGLSLTLRILDELGDALAEQFFASPDLKRLLELRNQYIHGVASVDEDRARLFVNKITHLLALPHEERRFEISNLKFERVLG